MLAESPSSDWYKEFFTGAALKVWREAISDEATGDELSFLTDTLALGDGASILDLPCGNGRLALPLAQAGYALTGIDFSEEYVREASALAKSKGLTKQAQFVSADMRALALDKTFDAAICMGNSFGYFNRVDTAKFLKAVAAHLVPGAPFVIDTLMVAECFLVNGGEREWVQVGTMHMLIENRYDFLNSLVETEYTFIESSGIIEKRNAVHWIYTSGELCRMLGEAGFDQCDLFGSADGEPFALGADRLIVVARKI